MKQILLKNKFPLKISYHAVQNKFALIRKEYRAGAQDALQEMEGKQATTELLA